MIVLGPSLAALRYVMYFRFMDRRYREFSIGRELRWAKEATWGPRVPPSQNNGHWASHGPL